ncbi:MAG TPA: septation protein SepH [Streptosporangiaceae bacterium]|nr:septation protein SepH [Streptosporangiaceae bacterium]
MQELRFVAVSEDGRYAVLAVPGRSARFTLPIDERLRAVALGQSSRLVQYEIEVESPLRPKEIQARIRAGETVEEIADAAGIAVERVRWFEGPVLAERAYAADQAQKASVRRQGEPAPSSPGPALGEIVAARLQAVGSDPEDAQWDAKKRGDNSWQVQLTFISGGRLHVAEWAFDQRRRHVLPVDDNAARMSLPGGEPPRPAAPPPGQATVTQLAPRLSTASGQFGQSGTGTAGIPSAAVGNGGPGRARDDDRRPSGPPAARHAAPAARPAEDSGAEPAAASPPAAPAPVAAQVARAPQARPSQPRPEESRPESAVPAAPSLARDEQPEPTGPAEPDGEQTVRQSRKAPRGKRASVPSWDEIMFGSARQRD